MSRATHRRWGSLLALALLALAAYWYAWLSEPSMRRIGIVPFTVVNDRVIQGFQEKLAENGWVQGRNVQYRIMPADGKLEALDARVKELLAWHPALIMSASTPPSQAAYRLTRGTDVPLVFAPVSDPLAAGIVKTLGHPGEQTTGVRLSTSNGLRLQWLQRMAPEAQVYYVPYSLNDKSSLVTLQQIEADARVLGLRLITTPLNSMDEIEQAARNIPAEAQAIFLPQDSRIEARIELYVRAAQEHHLPLSAPSLIQVEQGALMSYGFDHREIGRQAGRLASEILRGAQAGMLPVETAENYLAVNLQAAQAIGLTIDESTLRQAKLIIR